jgi:hypothetical protein
MVERHTAYCKISYAGNHERVHCLRLNFLRSLAGAMQPMSEIKTPKIDESDDGFYGPAASGPRTRWDSVQQCASCYGETSRQQEEAQCMHAQNYLHLGSSRAR